MIRRVNEHRNKIASSFTTRYNVDKRFFFEETSDVQAAIAREKQIKAGSRERKVALVNSMNPDWHDLFDDLIRRCESVRRSMGIASLRSQ